MDSQERWYQQTVSLKGQVVADAGANVGRLSQFFFSAVGPKGKVVSIEPVPANIKAIEKRIKKAGPAAKKRWALKKCAVGRDVGKVWLRMLKADWGTNAMVSEGGGPSDRLEVAARPLWDLVPDATVVKLDIEGHEYDVLPGALEAMAGVKAWLLELHDVAGHPLEATLALLVAKGYTLLAAGRTKSDQDGPWVSVPIDATLTWDRIEGTPTVRDGMPGVFKMLHVIAKKD